MKKAEGKTPTIIALELLGIGPDEPEYLQCLSTPLLKTMRQHFMRPIDAFEKGAFALNPLDKYRHVKDRIDFISIEMENRISLKNAPTNWEFFQWTNALRKGDWLQQHFSADEVLRWTREMTSIHGDHCFDRPRETQHFIDELAANIDVTAVSQSLLFAMASAFAVSRGYGGRHYTAKQNTRRFLLEHKHLATFRAATIDKIAAVTNSNSKAKMPRGRVDAGIRAIDDF